jgi:ribosomal protein S18 acetylase RimI-like enzyme
MKKEDRFPEPKWHLFVEPEDQQVAALRKKLSDFNIAKARTDQGFGLAILTNDLQKQLVGGIYGWVWGSCLEIDYLWVNENLRGMGYGKKLVTELERVAMARGCRIATLDTYNFQAPAFYESLGYVCFGVIDGYGPGYQKHFYKKELREEINTVKRPRT